MGQSWHGLKKKMEQDLLCKSLSGRVKYFITKYRESHDGAYSRFAVSVDGVEVIKGFNNGWLKSESEVERRERIKAGQFYTFDFTNARDYYLENSIDKSIFSEEHLVRLFVILDRRVGKRTLTNLMSNIEDQPIWLKQFYQLRLESENLINIDT